MGKALPSFNAGKSLGMFVVRKETMMKSRTKNLLSEVEIKKLVRVNFGESARVSGIEELKGGMFNAIYLVRLTNAGRDKVVLKVGVVPGTTLLTYERDVMPTEVECYRLIREQTSVPVPEVLAHDFSKTHIKSNYFFMTALEGVPLSAVSKKMEAENLGRVKAELARCLEQIHHVRGGYYGYFSDDPACQYSTWKKAFSRMFWQILADAREHKVKIPYQRIEEVLKENLSYLEDCDGPALVEYDCHEGNIFVKEGENGYEIEGIVDFERAFWGDPMADFPAAFVFADDIRKEKEFLEAYLKASGRAAYTKADAKRFLLYRMYICVIMASETFRYGFVYARMQGAWAKAQIEKCLKGLERGDT